MSENSEKKTNGEANNDEFSEVLQKEFEFTPTGLCHYKQRGIYLVCVSCEVQHAVFIGIDRFYVGDDESGKPILVDRNEYLKNGYKKYQKKK